MFLHHTDHTISRLNAAKDRHRARGTTGGKGHWRTVTATEVRAREAGMPCHELALAAVDAIWSEFRSWSAQGRIIPLGDFVPDCDFPF